MGSRKAPPRPKRVLIVDDDHDLLESLQVLVLDEGHEAIPASNGREAVAKYAEFEPDIVLLDVRMPGIDGYETFLHLIEHDPDARVVLTSAYAVDGARYKRAKEMSLCGILQKPVEFARLSNTIKKHAK